MKILANNKRGLHEYQVVEKLEAGIVLLGWEVKSIKQGKVNFQNSFVQMRDGEAFAIGLVIRPYKFSSNVEEKDQSRERKLLISKQQIKSWDLKSKQQGVTIIPTQFYLNDSNLIKLQIALVKGQKKYDKRAKLKAKDLKRRIEQDKKLL